MSFRAALGQARLLTLFLIAGMGWIVFTAAQVLGGINYWNPADVGQTAGAGVVGLLVLTAVLVAGLTLFSGLGHDEPAPNTWPPEDA
jgi:cytosine/uracil/thiamine/allantoin permease